MIKYTVPVYWKRIDDFDLWVSPVWEKSGELLIDFRCKQITVLDLQ